MKYDLLALRNKEATKTTDSMDYAGVTMATADSAVAERLSIKHLMKKELIDLGESCKSVYDKNCKKGQDEWETWLGSYYQFTVLLMLPHLWPRPVEYWSNGLRKRVMLQCSQDLTQDCKDQCVVWAALCWRGDREQSSIIQQVLWKQEL